MVAVITRWVLKIGFVVVVTALAYVSIPVAIIAIVATILVALNEKAGGIVELSFGPLKTKLERDLSEADKLLTKLRLLMHLQAKSSISAGVRAGRFAGSDGWLYDNVRALETALREVGLPEDQIREARRDFIRFAIIDAGYAVLGSNQVPGFLGDDAIAEWKALRAQPIKWDASKIDDFLDKWNLHSPERDELISDIRWMQDHDDIRDKEQYLRTQSDMPFERS